MDKERQTNKNPVLKDAGMESSLISLIFNTV